MYSVLVMYCVCAKKWNSLLFIDKKEYIEMCLYAISLFCHSQQQQMKYSANYKNIKYEDRDLLKLHLWKEPHH